MAPLRIPFKAVFRHASAERRESCSVWAKARSNDGLVGCGEGCPRPYVTGESIESVQAFLEAQQSPIKGAIADLGSLRSWITQHKAVIDANPAAWCAIELALLDLMGKQSDQSLEALLGLEALTGPFQYSAVLGDADPMAFEKQYQQYRHYGFTDFKLKLSGDIQRDKQKITAFRHNQNLRVRLDANNLWRDPHEVIDYIRALDCPLFAIEEPLTPNQYDKLLYIAEGLDSKIILDESFLRCEQFHQLPNRPDRWIINVRVSKMGGLLRCLEIVKRARALGIKLIVGAHVGETSLLTRAALTVAHAARDILLAQEGAFGTLLLEKDVCDPPLVFQRKGLLEPKDYFDRKVPGHGLSFRTDL
ncbi:MAG: enolase C-terminal domain-like protein [Acidiferrobacterales bacterium]